MSVLLTLLLQDPLDEILEIEAGMRRLAEVDRRRQELQEEHDKSGSERVLKKLKAAEAEFLQVERESRGRLPGFVERCAKELETKAGDWKLLEARGRALLLQWERERAAADLEASLKAKPGREEVERLLAETLCAVHRYEDALRWSKSPVISQFCRTALNRFEEIGEPADAPDFVVRILRRWRPHAARMAEAWKKERAADDLPRVRLTTAKGAIVLELFEDEAPNTVANFVSLVEKGFYDGGTFGSYMANEGIEGGGSPGYRIRREIARAHFRGSLSMAADGGRFLIGHLPLPWRDEKHTVFGRVVEGMDVVDRLRGGDALEKAEVIRKRAHAYAPEVIRD